MLNPTLSLLIENAMKIDKKISNYKLNKEKNMGKLIRHGVFETNSSSTHSLVVDRNGDYLGLTPNSNNEITVRPEDFGWSTINYSQPEEKLAYLLIYIRDWVPLESLKIAYKSKLVDMVSEHTGAEFVILEGEENDGYIDHQSVESGQLDPYFLDIDLMKDFVFGRGSYVETGNDNS